MPPEVHPIGLDMTNDHDEAKRVAYAQRSKVEATIERLCRDSPMRKRDYLVLAGGAVAIIGIPLVLLSFFF